MKSFCLTLLFFSSSVVQVNASTPKSITCSKTEYRGEYISGTKSKLSYINSYEIDVEIPCRGQDQTEKVADNDCKEGSFIKTLLGTGIVLTKSKGNDRFWAVTAGGTAGALMDVMWTGD